ncbi:hypothetical protein ES705_24042 [subsurface metagenome]
MEQFRDYLEILYFLSCPALVVIAYIALAQIKLAKNQIEVQRNANRVSAKRDALRLTSEQIKEYGVTIIPIINTLNKKIENENMEFFKKSEVVIGDDNFTVKPYSDDVEIEKLINIMPEFLNVMNALEGFSVFFVSGIADEKLAYRSLSTTFCNSVKNFLPLIVILSSDSNSFSITMKLFSIWNNRLDSEAIEQQMQGLEKKLRSKKEKTIRIIGDS